MNPSVPAEIAVLVVNYNTAALAIEAVESVLQRNHGGRRIEVNIVDNASPNGDAAILITALASPSWASRVSLRCEPENHGFGRANNLVLGDLMRRQKPPDYVFLLNPDACLENEAIAILADFLDSHDRAAAAGAAISNSDGVLSASAFRFPTVLGTFSSAANFGPVSWLLRNWEVALSAKIDTQKVDWVSGAAVMLRMAAISRTGFFDSGYFLYFEETDLMLRLSRDGAEVWHVSEARVQHVEGAATNINGRGNRVRLPDYWYRSWHHYFLKNHGRTRAIQAAGGWLLGSFLNLLVNSLRQRQPTVPLHFFSDVWTLVLRPLLRFWVPENE